MTVGYCRTLAYSFLAKWILRTRVSTRKAAQKTLAKSDASLSSWSSKCHTFPAHDRYKSLQNSFIKHDSAISPKVKIHDFSPFLSIFSTVFFKCKTLAAPWPPPLHRPLLPAPPPLAAWLAATPLAAAGRARRWATDWRTRSPAAFEQMVQKGIYDDLCLLCCIMLYHMFNVISINLGTGLS